MDDNLPLDEQIQRTMEYVNDPHDYELSIDIANRSRELAELYFKAKKLQYGASVLRLMMDYVAKVDGLNTGEYVAKDVERLLKIYEIQRAKDQTLAMLRSVIRQYPNYSRVSVWHKMLVMYQRKFQKQDKL